VFPDWLATKMTEGNLTQETLADVLGITQQAVSMWLKGTRQPGVRSARRLAEALGVRTDELFELLDSSPPPSEASDRAEEIAEIRAEMARLKIRLDRLAGPERGARRSS
jgi:transcriptional regulator with XRE-family HTH domain